MKHDMRKAIKHLEKHHHGNHDHARAHPEHHHGEKVHFSGGKPGHGHNLSPGSSKEGRKLTRMDED